MAGSNAGAPLTIAADHPAFAGHFPGNPVVPAVVLLAEAMAAVETATGREATAWTLASAKFLAPVAPGTALSLFHAPTRSGGLAFEIRAGDEIVASGTLAPR